MFRVLSSVETGLAYFVITMLTLKQRVKVPLYTMCKTTLSLFLTIKMLPELQGKLHAVSVFLLVFLLPMGWMNISTFFWNDNTNILLEYNYIEAAPGIFWLKFFIILVVIIVVVIILSAYKKEVYKLVGCLTYTPCVF